MIASSCSTTSSVFPLSRKSCITRTSRPISRGCRPTLGSSMTNNVFTSDAPRQVVRFTRWTSPPLRVRVGVLVARFAVNYEVLIGFRQVLERDPNIDLFPRAGPHQVALRFTHLFAAENPDRPLRDRQRAVRDRLVQVDRDGAPESAAFRTGAERIVKAEKSRSRRTNIEIAMGAMPAGGEGKLRVRS